jgi:hypothetical protein
MNSCFVTQYEILDTPSHEFTPLPTHDLRSEDIEYFLVDRFSQVVRQLLASMDRVDGNFLSDNVVAKEM